MSQEKQEGISFFNCYLTVWVFLCMAAGVLLGKAAPSVTAFLGNMTIAGISIPIAILIWVMIYPMMMKVDFESVREIGKNPKGLIVTWVVNWLIKPFTMYGIASFFLFVVFKAWIAPDIATQYLAGAVLLGAAPCTAMVFVWSTLFLSVLLFVVIPLAGGILTRISVIKSHGREYFEKTFIHKFDNATTIGLLLTLILIFAGQTEVILSNPLHIVLIAVPLILQTFLIFFIAYGACRILKLPYDISAPAAMIGASNFFELSVAVAIALFGTTSPAALATTVGVLTEVPVMLTLVRIANSTQDYFPKRKTR